MGLINARAHAPWKSALLSAKYLTCIELTIIAIVLSSWMIKNLPNQPFHKDEGHFIATSYCFDQLLEGNWRFDKDKEKGSYYALNAPPLARYLIGIGRFGCNRQICKPWDFNQSDAANEAQGRKPGAKLLYWSRVPMAVLGAISATALFFLLRKACGRLGAYFFLYIFSQSVYFNQMLSRAMTESGLSAFVLLAACLTYKALEKVRDSDDENRRIKTIWLLAAAGICCGIAASSKLNGMTAAVAVVLAMVIRCGKNGLLTFAFVVASTTLATFVALNPFLYPDPIGRSRAMINVRVTEMTLLQQDPLGITRLPTGERISLVIHRLYYSFFPTFLYTSIFLDGYLAIVGLLRLAILAFAAKDRQRRDAALVLVCFLLVLGIPALFSPADWDRYFLMPSLLVVVCVSAAIAFLFDLLLLLGRWLTRRTKNESSSTQDQSL